jgi:hypothetical protein
MPQEKIYQIKHKQSHLTENKRNRQPTIPYSEAHGENLPLPSPVAINYDNKQNVSTFLPFVSKSGAVFIVELCPWTQKVLGGR